MRKYKIGDRLRYKFAGCANYVDETLEVINITDQFYEFYNLTTKVNELDTIEFVEKTNGYYTLLPQSKQLLIPISGPIFTRDYYAPIKQQDKTVNNLICECGAKYTSNPNHHLSYCKLHRK